MEFENPKKCRICRDNFFLTSEFKCEPEKSFMIPYCQVYDQNLRCQRCKNQYFIDPIKKVCF